jgi:predicted RNase H-like HicB family nuclease
MLSYKAAYRMHLGAFTALVLDFPEATAFGATLAEARNNLQLALRYAAERKLRRGEMLPMPDPDAGDGEAYLVETLTVWPQSTDRVNVQAGS